MTIRIRSITLLLSAVVLFALVGIPWALATEDLGADLGMKCTSCHDKAGSKLLTSKGKYFELKGSMDGYDEGIKKYRKCTSCHAKEPGSLKLTAKGEKFKAKGKTMEHVGSAEDKTEADSEE